jgi:hypothetical protein
LLRPGRADLAAWLLLAAAAALSAAAIVRLPYKRGFWPTATPYDRWPVPDACRDFAFLSSVARYVPPRASVVVLTNPPDLGHDFYLHAFALGLFPDSRVLSASMWGKSYRAEALRRADFVVVMGDPPQPPPGPEVHRSAVGGVWRNAEGAAAGR